MIVLFIQFETPLTEDEVRAVAQERAPEFRALPDLVQKLYLKLDKPGHYGGFYVWKSREAMQAYRESDLAKSIPAAYQVIGTPKVDIHEVLFPLRAEAAFGPDRETA
ncbi:MAG: YdhR family protein [Rhodospirillaceae bacterium]|nr:YdhR family protein [Rhodospirillaceae bacterium]